MYSGGTCKMWDPSYEMKSVNRVGVIFFSCIAVLGVAAGEFGGVVGRVLCFCVM